jgi:hypothetical protein
MFSPDFTELKDESGLQIEIEVDQPVKQGDVSIEVVPAYKVFLQRKDKLEKVDYAFKQDKEMIEELKLKYPKKASEIVQDDSKKLFNYETFEEDANNLEVIVYTFYHRSINPMQDGRLVKFTRRAILENKSLPYSHGDLPFERLTDLIVPGELHGRSFYIHARHLQGHINNLTTMFMRNLYMAGHPKWFVPMGSVNLDSLGNDLTIVQYRGAVPPNLAQANPTGAETYNARRTLIEEMGTISGVHGVSRGEPPPGIKAGVALQFLSEQENERQNAFVAIYNEFQKNLAKKIIATAADFYLKTDRRRLKMIGKNNEYMAEYLDPVHLANNYDFIIQNSSSLPKSIAARTQQIIDLNESFPTMFTPEQVIDMLDMGKTDRFFNESTTTVRAAEEAYENLADGKEVPEPKEYEFHEFYWKIFSVKIQDPGFKRLPEERQTLVLDHLRAREFMMYEKLKISPSYYQTLAKLVNFPLLFHPEPEIIPQVQPTQQQQEPMPPQDYSSLDQVTKQMSTPMPVNPMMPAMKPGV